MSEKKEHKKNHKVDHKKKELSIADKLKNNPWILSTLIFGILAIVLLFSTISAPKVNVESSEVLGHKFVDFLNAKGSEVEYVSSEDYGDNLYQVIVLTQGQEVPAHITKDGKYFVQVVFPLDEEGEEGEEVQNDPEPTPSTTPKSDKPVVELFVMSYCPYGNQAEKGIIPAIEALGDSVDFTLRFVYYAMHPTYGEVEEQLNQYCIQKNEEDKLNDYLKCFLDKGEGALCLDSMGIDKDALTTCVEETDAEFDVIANLEDKGSWLNGRYPLFNIDKTLNEQYGIGGSPSLVINGEKVNSARDPASYLKAICAAFNNGPDACSAELSSTPFAPGFGYDVAGGTSDATCG